MSQAVIENAVINLRFAEPARRMDTDAWEQEDAQTLDHMYEVFAYLKNRNLGFTIVCPLNGERYNYYPEFFVQVGDGHTSSLRSAKNEIRAALHQKKV